MAIEQLLSELIDTNKQLIKALGGASVSSGTTKTDTTGGEEPGADDGEKKIAGKKTYIWFKDLNEGVIVERGEEIPTDNGAVAVQKGSWDTACKKYGVDPETGKKPVEKGGDDLDDLDDLGSDNIAGTDDDMGGLDDLDDLGDFEEEQEATISRDEVKKKLIEVMKKKDRETVQKIFAKFKAKNIESVKEEDLQALYDTAVKVLSK